MRCRPHTACPEHRTACRPTPGRETCESPGSRPLSSPAAGIRCIRARLSSCVFPPLYHVRTYYYGYMNVTLTVDEEVMRKARKQAEAMGTSVNQLIRDYLASFTSHHSNGAQLAQEYMELLRTSQ